MKKFAREMMGICLPLVIIGGGFGVWRVLHPPLDPNAKIQLTFKPDQPVYRYNGDYYVILEWEATVSDGPSHEFIPAYNQSVWAVGNNWKKQISAEPARPGIALTQGTGGGGWTPSGRNSIQSVSKEQTIEIPFQEIPWGTLKLEWRGNFAVAPSEEHQRGWPAVNSAELRQIGQLPNAITRNYTFSVPLTSAQSGPIYHLRKSDESKNSVRVNYLLDVGPHAINRRLIARDGQQQRLLWEDGMSGKTANLYWVRETVESSLGLDLHKVDFDLSRVPANQEVVFIIDAAYKRNVPPIPADSSEDKASLQTIGKLEKQGWYRESRAVVVRPNR